MTYSLNFLKSAKKEWDKLDAVNKERFKKKLAERLINPHNVKSKLSGIDNLYKIKLRSSAYRLVYQVKDDEMIVLVVTINKRDKNKVYNLMHSRASD